MDDSIVTLRNTPITLDSDVGRQFVVDCVRAGEGLITDRELAEKYELDPPAWIAITKDVELGHAIRAERERRVLNGVAAREAAAKHFVKAPGILDQIMTDAGANPRHKIEAIKELRQTAIRENTERLPESERFIIKIDLSAGGGPIDLAVAGGATAPAGAARDLLAMTGAARTIAGVLPGPCHGAAAAVAGVLIAVAKLQHDGAKRVIVVGAPNDSVSCAVVLVLEPEGSHV
jgi:hypothetical protein